MSVQRAPLPFILLGMAAAGERGSRAIASVGLRAAGIATRPAALLWDSPLGSPVRDRTAAVADGFARDGRELVARTRGQARTVAAEALLRVEDQLDRSELVDQAIDRVLGSRAFDRVIAAVINHPATEALVVNVLDEPGLDRLMTRVMESRLIDELTAQLLASDEMQLVLDFVIRSPEMRAALAHSTVGLADDVAVGVRSRTFVADAAAERFARGLLKRRRPPEAAR
jgi:hypothetical protein